MAITGSWTVYGRQQMHQVGMGAQPAPILYLALFEGSADPAGPPVELSMAGYGRQAISYVPSGDPNIALNGVDVAFGPLAAGSYQGLAVMDASTGGQAWMWGDSATVLTIPGSSVLTFAAGNVTSTQS